MKRGRQIVVVTTTVERRADAQRLARQIVETRLAACVQCAPIRSVYRWKGRVNTASEYQLAAKTPRTRAAALIKFIRKHHPYELPEILVLPVQGGLPAYLKWVATATAE
jgi:periplasmic divalent cation tolerance protein